MKRIFADQRYRDANRARVRLSSLAHRKRRAARHRALVERIKSAPCMDCGGTFPPYCMDFDHRAGTTKRDDICKLVHNATTDDLLDEIAKCDVVCANCHRIRTFTRVVAEGVPP